MSDAKHLDITAEQYHSHSAIGSSQLEDFRHSRRLFEGRYITKTIPLMQPTDAMQLGTWIHLRVLEPDKYKSLLAPPLPELAPDGKKWLRRKDSDHEKWWAEELAKREGLIAIDKATRQQIDEIAMSLLQKKWAKRLLEGDGQPEFSIFWTDAETGLRLKILVDWFSDICIDIKTTADPCPAQFVRTSVSLGYHRKAAMYKAGISAFTGEKNPALVHLAVGTTPPYSAGAYQLSDFDRYTNSSLGLMEWRYTLLSLAKCLETGDFSDSWEHQVMDLELPAYAFTQQHYQT